MNGILFVKVVYSSWKREYLRNEHAKVQRFLSAGRKCVFSSTGGKNNCARERKSRVHLSLSFSRPTE